MKLAIIPARGGSKRIPRKNIKLFFGKPIIAYSIEAALQSGLFDEVMVSTDDFEIAEIAKKYGAKVPFFRSEKASDDFATTCDVIKEVLEQYQKGGSHFEYACCIYPCAPLVTSTELRDGFQTLIDNNYDSVFPVIAFSYPIQRALKFGDDKKISYFYPESSRTRSQDLEHSFHDAGQFYWMNVAECLKKNAMLTDNTGSIVITEMEAQDIDTEMDWKLAELKYNLLLNN